MKSAVLSSGLICSIAHARKLLVDAEGHTVQQAHKVKDCQQRCILKDDTNSWCFEFATPILQAGWTYD